MYLNPIPISLFALHFILHCGLFQLSYKFFYLKGIRIYWWKNCWTEYLYLIYLIWIWYIYRKAILNIKILIDRYASDYDQTSSKQNTWIMDLHFLWSEKNWIDEHLLSPKKSFLRHTVQRVAKKARNGATFTMYFHVSLTLLFVFLNSSFLLVLSLFPLLVCNKTFFKLSFCFSYFSPFYDANCSFFHFTVLVFPNHG